MISTGQYSTLVKRTDMSVFGFGNNTEEQLSSLNGSTISTPELIFDLEGVTFIEASKSSSHFIYNEDQLCSSQAVIVDAMTVPSIKLHFLLALVPRAGRAGLHVIAPPIRRL